MIPGRGPSPDSSSRRLTFMVGFWDHISARDRGVDSPGPGQHLPDPATSRYTWIHELMNTENAGNANINDKIERSIEVERLTVPVESVHVSSIWEPTESESTTAPINNTTSSESSKRVKTQGTPEYHHCFQGF